MPLIKKDIVIVGAGAAGLMCAIEAAKRNRSILVLEHKKVAQKVRASGGGHCNFTNRSIQSDNYLSNNPHFCKSALAQFAPNDFINMVEKHKIDYYEKEKGQLFCCGTSGEIVRMLHNECNEAGVEIKLGCKISNVTKKTNNFLISTNFGKVEAESLVVATGGLSYPQLGATDLGFRIAQKFGLNVTQLRPALVPLVFCQSDLASFKELSGVSFEAVVSCQKRQFRGEVLFTHKGISGPAILQISSYWNKGEEICIDLMPDKDIYELFLSKRTSKMELSSFLSFHLPKRFCKRWCELYAPSKPVNIFTEKELKYIANHLHHWTIKPEGTEGYKKAEVTAGGVDTDELSSKTMETKKVPGLYFIGEVVDITGQLGGYNLQWAWSSGFVAGQYV